jgi:S-DNA-T family DNA segregation ATPase FtsK/SpoIIIE
MAYQSRDRAPRAPLVDARTQAALERRGRELLGLGLIAAGGLAALMLGTYSPDDPNWMLASDAPTGNWLGRFGASVAHPLMMIVGRAAWGIPLVLLVWGVRLATHRAELKARAVFAPILIAALAAAMAAVPAGDGWTAAYGMGGLFGDTALGVALTVLPLGTLLVSLLVWAGAGALGLFVLGVTRAEAQVARERAAMGAVLAYAWALRTGARALLRVLDLVEAGRARAHEAKEARAARRAEEEARAAEEAAALRLIPDPEGRPERLMPGVPGPAARAAILRPVVPEPRSTLMPPPLAPVALEEADDWDDIGGLADPGEIEEELWSPAPPPAFLAAPPREEAPAKKGFFGSLLGRAKAEAAEEDDGDAVPVLDDRIRGKIGEAIRAREAAKAEPPVLVAPVLAPVLAPVALPAAPIPAPTALRDAPPEPAPAAPVLRAEPLRPRETSLPAPRPQVRPAQPALPAYEPPPLDLLADPKGVQRHHLSDQQLSDNARALEQVLDDFGVKGEIVSVRPGPVVTMYELEPAPGLKASRVIGLADDIARNMSALSARVSTVPGRNVIGIELPNERREKVVLREILSARAFGDGTHRLPLALGKDIGGEPVIANLAKMPHLLIAGTTGSGKSVAINTMILSLLYSLTPEECRLIMIDPKMLELSVYDGIPHLLSPVVTDPRKAVVALKWVVGEMEERYRKMSKMGVRNIEGYNGRVRDALDKGEMFSRTVQTGFDDETGDPVFETDEFMPEVLPFIVVVVDEMADLMMVAGKEIEACIQRLAQMARASGIHIIMATQRPSVDVITGTIKANFPTRISFQVTSKIDSRTILGEQGAEQLLGQGDMLYMAGGGRITRIHGPFCSDEEVEEIVTFLKGFGPPTYVGAVLEEQPDDGEEAPSGIIASAEGDDALYDMAVQIVAKDRKCSTSYIQRKLAIGYNKAARLVEQMEERGVVTSANQVGKREILVPEPH